MYAFKYERPTALADAQKAAQAGGQVLAGGQTMIAAMKQRLQQPETLIDLAAISGLAGVKKDGNNIVIGAMTRHQDVADNADVKQHIPGLATLAILNSAAVLLPSLYPTNSPFIQIYIAPLTPAKCKYRSFPFQFVGISKLRL